MRYGFVFWVTALCIPSAAVGNDFLCAGILSAHEETEEANRAAKRAQGSTEGTRNAIAIFAQFRGELPGWNEIPAWSQDIFNPDLPGSFSHFYDTMSFGRMRVRGEVASRPYTSRQPAAAYLADDPTESGNYGQFVLEILEQVDRDIDFSRFDNDGPDGIPNSDDDDGKVDAVFIILASAPQNFLLGRATGISYLDLGDERIVDSNRIKGAEFITDDIGFGGRPILVASGRGTLQEGRTLAGAVGSLCHEYGHVLGLPDLYNTGFLQKKDALPEEDSAGIGAWGLMGWGASGWNGDDGPNSFCAWSRLQLGWAEAAEVTQEVQKVRLAEVGQSGQILKIRLTDREYFLAEYREGSSHHYDRHIPGEGLLIWHVDPRRRGSEEYLSAPSPLSTVDLECADGRWLDAGYPLGQKPDGRHGGDNLDFWAHDPAYSQAHGGNLGDATDLFDGTRSRAFTPETNPASYSNEGNRQIRIEEIDIRDGVAHLTVRVEPPRIEVEKIELVDESEDGLLVAGEEALVRIRAINTGGLVASEVSAVVQSDDPYVEVLQSVCDFGSLDIGSPGSSSVYPRLRIKGGFAGIHAAKLRVDIYMDDTVVESEEVSVPVAAARQTVEWAAVIDSAGNQDGVAQAGEFVSLSLKLAVEDAAPLAALQFSLSALDPRLRRVGSAQVEFQAYGDRQVLSHSAPEFLLPADIAAGEELGFKLAVNTGWETWEDTLYIEVGQGRDATPPRVSLLQTQRAEEGLAIFLSDRWILDGGQLGAARAVLYSTDTTQVAAVPLDRKEGRYEGVWITETSGRYLIQAEVEDESGNTGYSDLVPTAVFPPGQHSGAAFAVAGPWRDLVLPVEDRPAKVTHIAVAPTSPEVWYAASETALWRSEDAGASWVRTGLMLNGLYNTIEIYVDPVDPFTVYLKEFGHLLVSRDGGNQWTRMPVPGPGVSIFGLDPLLSGRIYGWQDDNLFLSEDQGKTWQEVALEGVLRFVETHPADPRSIFVLSREYTAGSDVDGAILWYSLDDGNTWTRQQLEKPFQRFFPDPRAAEALYATTSEGIWHSPDRGRTWQRLDVNLGSPELSFHPSEPGLIYAYRWKTLWHSLDHGDSWESVQMPGAIESIALFQDDPRGLLLTLYTGAEGKGTLYRAKEFGAVLKAIEFREEDLVTGAIAFAPDGRIFISSRAGYDSGASEPGVFTSPNGGFSWEWRESSSHLPFFDVLHVDPHHPDIIIAHLSLGFNQYRRTVDGGDSWQGMSIAQGAGSASGGEIRLSPPIVADPFREGIYYLGDFQLFRSRDFGETWEKRGPFERNFTAGINFNSIGGLALDPEYDGSIYTSLGDSIWHSDDAGETWTVFGRIQSGEGIFALGFHPVDLDRMYGVTTGGFYLSENKGKTWTRTLEPAAGRWISSRLRETPGDPDGLVLISSRELYASRDGGFTWKSLGASFGGQPWFHDLAVDPTHPSHLYAATTWGVYRLDQERITAVEEVSNLFPQSFMLGQNYPNPFNSRTTITYQLPRVEPVELVVFNIAGQRVKKLVDKIQSPGQYQVVWNGADNAGRPVGSGVYFYRLATDTHVQTRRMLLLK